MFNKIILLSLSFASVIKCELRYNFINKFEIPVDVELSITHSPNLNYKDFLKKVSLKEKGSETIVVPEDINLTNESTTVKFKVSAKGITPIKKEIEDEGRFRRIRFASKNIILSPVTKINVDIKDLE